MKETREQIEKGAAIAAEVETNLQQEKEALQVGTRQLTTIRITQHVCSDFGLDCFVHCSLGLLLNVLVMKNL